MDEKPSVGPGRAVLISLSIEQDQPITGRLTVDGRTGQQPFCGWMELIAAITEGCQPSTPPAPRSPAGTDTTGWEARGD